MQVLLWTVGTLAMFSGIASRADSSRIICKVKCGEYVSLDAPLSAAGRARGPRSSVRTKKCLVCCSIWFHLAVREKKGDCETCLEWFEDVIELRRRQI